MLVVHMDSGLGNQMLDYAEYLAIKKSNPGKECYLENMIYEIPCHEGMFSMWNGYELDKIFGIQMPNIKDRFGTEQWNRILKQVEASEFWKENWNYPPYIIKAFESEGLKLNNFGKKPGSGLAVSVTFKAKIRCRLTHFFQTMPGYHMKRIAKQMLEQQFVKKKNGQYDLFREYPDNSFAGHSLAFRYKGFGIETIEAEIRDAFQFPEITDEKNIKILSIIHQTDSVAIHARRSDMLFVNGYCYKYGFFKRAVRYIKKHVKEPVFIFFTDENSVGWCEKNEKIFGLDFRRDKVEFVTWNKGKESFRDMQLMAQCRHNIFTESSFGFWGAYLNENPEKITCAPDCTMLATNTF